MRAQRCGSMLMVTQWMSVGSSTSLPKVHAAFAQYSEAIDWLRLSAKVFPWHDISYTLCVNVEINLLSSRYAGER